MMKLFIGDPREKLRDLFDPAKGLKRLISPRSAWEASKQTARVSLLSLVAWKTVSGFVPMATAAGPLSSTAIASLVATRALGLVRQVAGIGLGLAVLDYVIEYTRERLSPVDWHTVVWYSKTASGYWAGITRMYGK